MATSPKLQFSAQGGPAYSWKQILRKAYNAIYWLLLFNVLAFGWPGRALASSGDGLLSYGSSTAGSVGQKYRTWTPSSYNGETAGPTITCGSGDPTINWTVLKSSPVNPAVYVLAVMYTCLNGVDPDTYHVQVWSKDGAGAWASEWSANPSLSQRSYRGVDVAFENTSGNVLVVYLLAADTDTIYYQEGTWNSGTGNYDWSASSFTDATIGNFRWLRLANKLNSDQMVLGATGDDATNQVNAWIWSGAAFGNEGGNAGWGLIYLTQDNMDAAHETSTGEALVVWGIATGIKWATYNGGWSTGTYTTANVPFEDVALTADPGPTADDMALGIIEDASSDDVWGSIWTGAAWASHTELDANTGASSGRNIDVAYAGTTGNAILVFADSSGATIDWARSTGDGAFAVQTDYDPTPTFGVENIIALVPDASSSNVIMDNFVDANSDLWGFYYDDDDGGAVPPYWHDPVGAALDADSSGGLTIESFMFAWESVYKVPTLTEILFLALVGCAVFLGIKTGVIKWKKPSGHIDPPLPPAPKDLSNINQISNTNHQNQSLPRRSIDGIQRIRRDKDK